MSGRVLNPAIQDNVTQPSLLSRGYGSLSAETRKTSSAGVNLWFDYDSEIAMTDGKSHAKVRYHPRSGSGHAKHRRTRSGCFTCRARRVKVAVSENAKATRVFTDLIHHLV